MPEREGEMGQATSIVLDEKTGTVDLHGRGMDDIPRTVRLVRRSDPQCPGCEPSYIELWAQY